MAPPALVKPDPKTPTKRSELNGVIDWINYLNSIAGLSPNGAVINGGFEQYTGTNNVPDQWTFVPYPNGTGAIDTGSQSDGLRSFKIVVPSGGGSNGGGYLETTNPISVSNLTDLYVKWSYKTDVATTTNQVEIRWFQSDGTTPASTATTVIWSANSGQSSSWRRNSGKVLSANIPSNARFYKIRLTGGSVGSVAGNVWYDSVDVFKPVNRNKWLFIPSTITWTVPEDCVSFEVFMQGAGGGGGGGTTLTGGGGGGGAYNEIQVDAAIGDAIIFGIGTGGTGGTGAVGDGLNGGQTIVQKNGTTIYTVNGGNGGLRSNPNGTGGAGAPANALDSTNIVMGVNGTGGVTRGAGGIGGSPMASSINGANYFSTHGAGGAGGNNGSGTVGATGQNGYILVRY